MAHNPPHKSVTPLSIHFVPQEFLAMKKTDDDESVAVERNYEQVLDLEQLARLYVSSVQPSYGLLRGDREESPPLLREGVIEFQHALRLADLLTCIHTPPNADRSRLLLDIWAAAICMDE